MSISQTSPLMSRKFIGNNLAGSLESVGNNSITRHTPWASPIPVYNPNTSYGTSYNADYGKSVRIKKIGKEIVGKKAEVPGLVKPQGIKVHSKLKSAMKVLDVYTDQISRYGRKISPLELNHKLDYRDDIFGDFVEKRSFSPKISRGNVDWLSRTEKKQNVEKIFKGEFIPDMNHLQLYGRKAEKSKFEQRGLWVVNNSLIDNSFNSKNNFY